MTIRPLYHPTRGARVPRAACLPVHGSLGGKALACKPPVPPLALALMLLAMASLAIAPAAVLAGGQGGAAGVTPAGTAFTYQGRLNQGGVPVNSTCDFEFSLWDAAVGPTQIGSTLSVNSVTVTDGLFTVQLDFEAAAFNGNARWLQIAVRCPAGAGAFTTLSPRQPLTPAPIALTLPGLWTEQNLVSPNLIGGFSANSVTTGVAGATISGGGAIGFKNRVTDDFGTVGGGLSNQAGDGAGSASDRRFTTVGGGQNNTASGLDATVGGGFGNKATAAFATIAGGGRSVVGDPLTGNRVTDEYGTIGGGGNNQAGDNAGTAVDAKFATVGGGFENTARGASSFVGGGSVNKAIGIFSTVGGGSNNIAGNTARSIGSFVGGGIFNKALGDFSTVPGGQQNNAEGLYSFAAGRGAKVAAAHDGSFLFADSSAFDFNSSAANEFRVRSTGGACFVSGIDGSGMPNAGVTLAPGASSWSPLSDRNSKENFKAVDAVEVLNRLAAIPIESWNYKSQDQSIRHIGPMGQDFYAAFAVGEDDRHITTIDADGVALAAIQGLYEIVQERDEEISALNARLAALEALVQQFVSPSDGGAP